MTYSNFLLASLLLGWAGSSLAQSGEGPRNESVAEIAKICSLDSMGVEWHENADRSISFLDITDATLAPDGKFMTAIRCISPWAYSQNRTLNIVGRGK